MSCEPVASPCRRQCCLNNDDLCLGCGRSLAEIREWKQAGDARRLQIIDLAELRRQSFPAL